VLPTFGRMMSDTQSHHSRPVYFFVHVPKCAGTTFINHFATHSRDRLAHAPRLESFKRLLGGSYSDISAIAPRKDSLDIIAGHSLSQSLRELFEDRELREIVLIREPLDFVISFYNYKNRRAKQKGRGPISFELFYKSIPINPVSRFIINRYLEIGYPTILKYSSQDRLDALNAVFSRFWFVGSHKHCSEVVAAISQELGLPAQVSTANVATDDRLRVEDLPDSMKDRIRRENRLDQCLFEMWSEARWSGKPASSSIVLSDRDQPAHISREVFRNFTYPVIHYQRWSHASSGAS